MAKKVGKFLYWTPRVLSILFVAFLFLFSLDVIELGFGFWGTLLAFLIHSIPAIILLILLLVSWRREIVGGIIFILFGIAYIFLNLITIFKNGFEWYYFAWIVQFSGISFLIGILFLLNWKRKKKR